MTVRPPSAEPFAFWVQHCRTKPVGRDDLLAMIFYLKQEKQFVDVEALLKAYLGHREREPEPWMYEMLAVALEINKRKPEDVAKALGYAADVASDPRRVRNPIDLTRVADLLSMHGMNDRAGALLDLAAELDPGFPKPLLMSLMLARRVQDPERMGAAAEGLLALGWPGYDELWRTEVRKHAGALADTLKEGGRADEAAALLARVEQAATRDVFARLSWSGDADLDLVVEEPLGATAQVLTPRTVFGGAIVKNGYGNHPEEVYVCPRGFDGPYTFRVETVWNDPKAPVREAQLEVVLHEGTDRERSVTHTVAVTAPKPVVVPLEGGRRTEVLPFKATPTPEQAGPSAPSAPRPDAPALHPASSPSRAADALRPRPPAPPVDASRPPSGSRSRPRP